MKMWTVSHVETVSFCNLQRQLISALHLHSYVVAAYLI